MNDLALCRRLLHEADRLRSDAPKRALRLAQGARDLAAVLDRDRLGATWLAVQAEAWATLGSAYRAVAELERAEEALNIALAFLASTELAAHNDPLAEARLAQRASYLRCDQGRFEEALALNADAVAVYAERSATQRLAVALVDRGVLLGRAGEVASAIPFLARALDLLEPRRGNARTLLAAVHNLALYLYELAESRREHLEAREWLRLATRLHARFPESVNLMKLRAVEGLVAVRLGDVEEGVEKLWAAHRGFAELGSAHNQALVLLLLAGVFLGRGDTRQVRRIAGWLFPLFHSLKVDRETTAALRLFYDAAQVDAASVELVERVARRVDRRWRRGASRRWL